MDEKTSKNELCKLHLYIKKIVDYEQGLIPKIKYYLYPRPDEYKFSINDIVKNIFYEMSYHNHNDEYSNYMNKNTYCECFFNRKHRKLNSLKRHKCVKIMKILDYIYDADTYEKKYKCGSGHGFKFICYKTDDELQEISE